MPADRGDAACIVAGVRKWRRCFESLAACVPSDAGNLQVHHCRAPCRANFGISAQAPDIARAAGAHHRRVGRRTGRRRPSRASSPELMRPMPLSSVHLAPGNKAGHAGLHHSVEPDARRDVVPNLPHGVFR
jgi:hypothetical protein